MYLLSIFISSLLPSQFDKLILQFLYFMEKLNEVNWIKNKKPLHIMGRESITCLHRKFGQNDTTRNFRFATFSFVLLCIIIHILLNWVNILPYLGKFWWSMTFPREKFFYRIYYLRLYGKTTFRLVSLDYREGISIWKKSAQSNVPRCEI